MLCTGFFCKLNMFYMFKTFVTLLSDTPLNYVWQCRMEQNVMSKLSVNCLIS